MLTAMPTMAPNNMTRAPQTLPAPRKSFVILPRLPCGSVFPLLPASYLSDMLQSPHSGGLSAAHARLCPPRRTISLSFVALGKLTYGSRRATVFDAVAWVGIPTCLHAGATHYGRRFPSGLLTVRNSPSPTISDANRIADVTATLARGNHRSTRGHKAKLLEMLKDKVKRSWQLLLPKEGAFEQGGVADDHRSQWS
jgi:hypothetical protein